MRVIKLRYFQWPMQDYVYFCSHNSPTCFPVLKPCRARELVCWVLEGWSLQKCKTIIIAALWQHSSGVARMRWKGGMGTTNGWQICSSSGWCQNSFIPTPPTSSYGHTYKTTIKPSLIWSHSAKSICSFSTVLQGTLNKCCPLKRV